MSFTDWAIWSWGGWQYSFMFPLSICIATIAMTFGIGGAAFFSPTFIVIFPLVGVPEMSASQSFMTSLLTEMAGFTSGLIGYVFHRLIDWRTGIMLSMIGVPFGVIGAVVLLVIPWDYVLDWLFAAGMFGLAVFVAYHHKSLEKLDEEQIAVRDDDAIMAVCAVSEDMGNDRTVQKSDSESSPLLSPIEVEKDTVDELDASYAEAVQDETGTLEVEDMWAEQKLKHIDPEAPKGFSLRDAFSSKNGEEVSWQYFSRERLYHWMTYRYLHDRKGNVYVFSLCQIWLGSTMVIIGSFFTGLISVGIGEATVSSLRQCTAPLSIAAATSVFVTFMVILGANITNLIIRGVHEIPLDVVVWTVPGVLIGGQIGPWMGSKFQKPWKDWVLVAIFACLGLIMAGMGLLKFENYTLLPFWDYV